MPQTNDTTQTPSVPALYELVVVDGSANVCETALAVARSGGEEGQVFWSNSPAQAQVRSGRWHSGAGNLAFAILLQPEYSWERALELIYVANVALVRGVAALASPMTPVQFGWPNRMIMAGLTAGSVWLDLPDKASTEDNDRPPQWAIVTFAINLGSYPETVEDAISIQALQGEVDFTANDLLDQILRQFLSWINVWAEDGIGELTRTISPRMFADPAQLRRWVDHLSADTLRGDGELSQSGLDLNGALMVCENERSLSPLTLSRWYQHDQSS